MSEFRKNIQITFEDYKAFNLSHSEAKKRKWRFLLWGLVVITTLFYITGVLNYLAIVKEGHSVPFDILLHSIEFFIVTILPCIFFFIFKFLFKQLFLFRVKQAYKTKVLTKNQTELTVNDEGIKVVGLQKEVSANWSQILQIMENESTINIYFSRIRAFIIPKRYFNSLDELLSFRDFIQSSSQKEIKYLPAGKK